MFVLLFEPQLQTNSNNIGVAGSSKDTIYLRYFQLLIFRYCNNNACFSVKSLHVGSLATATFQKKLCIAM